MTRLVHIATYARPGGGMQTLVGWHQRNDPVHGFHPAVATVFESSVEGGADVGLAASGWWSLRRVRKEAAQRFGPLTRAGVVVYHNAWAMPHLAPADGAHRRIAYLHTEWPGLAKALPAIARWSDAILCMSPEFSHFVRRAVPGFPTSRVQVVNYPVLAEEAADLDQRSTEDHPPTVGFVGRLVVEQKRVDRLPALMASAGAGCSSPIKWRVIGDGPARARLQRACRGKDVEFLGWLDRAAYWRALRTLDLIVFLSDFEGMPLALLDAMACGVVPLYPAIGGSAERHVRQIATRCVYPPGDVGAAGRQLASLLDAEPALRQALAAKARAAVAEHTPAVYGMAFAGACRLAINQPRHSPVAERIAPRLRDRLPLGLLRRLLPDALWH